MRHKRTANDDAPGQDSFLDVVANLVGILIILIMVVGARAKDAWVQSAEQPASDEVKELGDAVRVAKGAAAALEADINEIAKKSTIHAAAVAARRAERNQIQLAITAAEYELSRQRRQLDSKDQKILDLRKDLSAAKEKLEELRRQRNAASISPNSIR